MRRRIGGEAIVGRKGHVSFAQTAGAARKERA